MIKSKHNKAKAISCSQNNPQQDKQSVSKEQYVEEYSIQNKQRPWQWYCKKLVLAFVIVGLLFFACGIKYARYLEGEPFFDVAEASSIVQVESFEKPAASTDFVVCVEGMAAKTGYFSIENDTSLRELIEYAGVLPEGDISDFDFTHKPQKHDIYYIKGTSNPLETRDWLTMAAAEAEELPNASEIININTAAKAELKELAGIGDAKAQAIIDYRTKNGSFKRIEDILAVRGIGDKLYQGFKERICVE